MKMHTEDLEVLAVIWRTYISSVPRKRRDRIEVDEEVGESVFTRINSAIGPLDKIGGFMLADSPSSVKPANMSLSAQERTTIRRALIAVRQEIGDEEFELRGGVSAAEAISLLDSVG